MQPRLSFVIYNLQCVILLYLAGREITILRRVPYIFLSNLFVHTSYKHVLGFRLIIKISVVSITTWQSGLKE